MLPNQYDLAEREQCECIDKGTCHRMQAERDRVITVQAEQIARLKLLVARLQRTIQELEKIAGVRSEP